MGGNILQVGSLKGSPLKKISMLLFSLGMGYLITKIYFKQLIWQLPAVFIVAPLIFGFCHNFDQQRRKQRLNIYLRQSLDLLAFFLRVGKSLSEATICVAKEQHRIGFDSQYNAAWQESTMLISLNHPIGRVYERLAQQLANEQAYTLAGILETGMKTGANLVRIAEETGLRLQAQLDHEDTRAARLAARRLEGCILLAAPLILTMILSGTLEDYMAPLFAGRGCIIMWLILLIQLGGGQWLLRLLNQAKEQDDANEVANYMDSLALLLQAGLTLPAAWQQAAAMQKKVRQAKSVINKGAGKGDDDAFFRCVQQVSGALAFNGAFAAALEIMLQDCNHKQADLAVLLQQNIRKGGDHLAYLLMQEAAQIRKREAQRQVVREGRKEILLLFPLVLMLLSSLLLTAAPAVISLRR